MSARKSLQRYERHRPSTRARVGGWSWRKHAIPARMLGERRQSGEQCFQLADGHTDISRFLPTAIVRRQWPVSLDAEESHGGVWDWHHKRGKPLDVGRHTNGAKRAPFAAFVLVLPGSISGVVVNAPLSHETGAWRRDVKRLG